VVSKVIRVTLVFTAIVKLGRERTVGVRYADSVVTRRPRESMYVTTECQCADSVLLKKILLNCWTSKRRLILYQQGKAQWQSANFRYTKRPIECVQVCAQRYPHAGTCINKPLGGERMIAVEPNYTRDSESVSHAFDICCYLRSDHRHHARLP
jgi:hypothetical protein